MYRQLWKDYLFNCREEGGHLKTKCPFCADRKQHFYANSSTGACDCKLCGYAGNAITFLRDHKRLDNNEIAGELSRYGINDNGQAVSLPEAPRQEFNDELVRKYESALTEDRLKALSEERGISVDTLKAHRVGWDGYAYTIPVFDEDGKIRNIFRKDGKDTKSAKGGENILFGSSDFAGSNGKLVFVVEGCWSAMSLRERGFFAVGLAGAGQLKDRQVRLFKDKEVILLPDMDPEGQSGMQKVAEKLKGTARSLRLVDLTGKVKEKQDVRDYFKAGGNKEGLEDVIGKAEIIKQEIQREEPAKKVLFSADFLPEGLLKDYIRFAEPLTEAPAQYHIATALVMIATLLGRNIYLREGAGYIYPNIYALVIGKSGITRKSTAAGFMGAFLNKINGDLMLGAAMSKEALLEAFRDHPCRVIYLDEFKQLTDSAGKTYGEGLITDLTSLWSCPSRLRVDFKNIAKDQRIIQNPTLSILACTTDDWLINKESDFAGGFMGRFLPVYAEDVSKRLAIPPKMDEAVFGALLDRLEKLRRVEGEYTWTDEARAIFEGLYAEICDDFDKEPRKGMILPYWSRINTHVKKLAMIFDATSPERTFTITKGNLMLAYGIMGIITDNYRGMLSRSTFSWIHKKENQLLDMIRDAGQEGLKRSEAMQALHLSAKHMNELELNLLEQELVRVERQDSKTNKKVIYYGAK